MKIGLALCVFLPFKIKRFIYKNIYGYKVSTSARIGISYINVENFLISDGARIGHFNKIDNLKSVQIDENASIGSWNSISGPKRVHTFENESCFHLGKYSSITARHRFDCSASVVIGNFTTIAGHGTSIFTHGIDIYENLQSASGVKIGNYCLISSNCLILKGSRLPNKSLLAAGSVLTKAMDAELTLYAGQPAVAKKPLDEQAKYFSRTVGRVEWP